MITHSDDGSTLDKSPEFAPEEASWGARPLPRPRPREVPLGILRLDGEGGDCDVDGQAARGGDVWRGPVLDQVERDVVQTDL